VPETVTVGDQGIVTGKLSNVQVKQAEPPHIALAKTSLTQGSISAFTKRYGPIADPSRAFAPGLRRIKGGAFHPVTHDAALAVSPQNLLSLGADSAVSETFTFSINEFAEKKDRLLLAWRGDRLAIEVLRQSISIADFRVSFFNSRGGMKNVSLRTNSLWDYICLLFLIDHDAGKARVCANPKCVTPYFLQGRADNNFCRHGCAVTAGNIRRAEEKRKERR
ncbi:MAG: hypothetical protein ABSE44_04290, partial [Candidatus Sulfotelmatobacter sp.]